MIVNINDVFKLPITYNTKTKQTDDTVVNNLELTTTTFIGDVMDKDTTDTTDVPIYDTIFKPSNKASLQVITQMAKYYTTDTTYLKETQTFVNALNDEELNTIKNKHGFSDFDMDDMFNTFNEIKNETGFLEKYLYIDWSFAKELNNNPHFLQCMSLYNISSPLLSLCLPIIILIIPFIIIKLKGIELNVGEYFEILKMLVSNHSIFKVFTEFNNVDNGQKLYLVISAAFYVFSIYQNMLVCVRFYSNMKKIHNYLFKFKKYLAYTIDVMNYCVFKTHKLTKYADFTSYMLDYKGELSKILDNISKITPFCFSFSKLGEVGHIMHTFYQIYNDNTYNNALVYSFGFNGYFNMMCQLKTNITNNKLGKTTFIKRNNKKQHKKPIFKKMYYPKFINNDENDIVTNNCDLNKNIIITGPNASGKTTTLKTALINILLSQQFGYGCFEELKLTPFDKIHCYLNIPDTSGRDSLFQAEARRCKGIINSINENDDDTHFCIFDELYSGTNPEEAVVSASAFMNYITRKNNVTCMLTTHYIKLCKKLLKNANISNYNMNIIKENDNFKYTYKMQKGISRIKGGLKVLHDMEYPKEILDNTTNQ
jgi:hypothetical protein